MRLGLICCSSDEEVIEGFVIPFRETAVYMSMEWMGDVHCWVKNGDLPVQVKEELGKMAMGLN